MDKQILREANAHRWIAISGLVFIAAWVIGLALTSPPPATAPTADLVTYYQTHKALVIAQTYLTNGLTGFVLIVFTSALYSALRNLKRTGSTLLNLLFGAGLVAASLSCLEALFPLVLASHIAATGDAAVIRTLLYLNIEVDIFKLVVLAIMIGATSLLTSRMQLSPRWLVWIGIIEALLLLIASWEPLFENTLLTIVLYASGIGLLVWFGAVSVVMGWQGRAIWAREALQISENY